MTPQLRLDLPLVLCNIHSIVFKSKWPKGYPTFTIRATDVLLADDNFRRGVGRREEDKYFVESVELLLRRKPICCRLSKPQMLQLYQGCGVGESGICQVCMQYEMGTPIETVKRNYRHVCFTCHLWRFVNANQNRPKS